LKDLGASDKPTITVFNKIDAFKPAQMNPDEEVEPVTLEDFKNSWMAKNNSPAIFISATKKENIEEFKSLLYQYVKDIHVDRYPYDHLLY
jgi:GTP-binding protein HflX